MPLWTIQNSYNDSDRGLESSIASQKWVVLGTFACARRKISWTSGRKLEFIRMEKPSSMPGELLINICSKSLHELWNIGGGTIFERTKLPSKGELTIMVLTEKNRVTYISQNS